MRIRPTTFSELVAYVHGAFSPRRRTRVVCEIETDKRGMQRVEWTIYVRPFLADEPSDFVDGQTLEAVLAEFDHRFLAPRAESDAAAEAGKVDLV
jgi:hypothetical protein